MRAKPFFSYTLVATALALPAPAYALALGKLTVTSALGQPLSAQIELASATREELESLTAKVADPSLYRQNNLNYQGVLARTRITVERTPDGRALLRVTSPNAVNEPFLDLMVEVNWASGRVVREYTFLLDPPGTGTMVAVEPVAPARAATTASAPQASAPVGRDAPRVAAPIATAPADGHSVRRGETLSKIAQQYKPADVTLEQMLVALFNANANRNAFEGNNMNRLRAGAILSIPSAADVSTTQAAEASKTVRIQAADWRSYRDRVAAAAPSVDGTGTREASGRISAAAEDRATPAPAGRDQLRVSREAGTGRSGRGEDAVALNKQLADANSRIAELEKTVQDMRRAMELRSPALAQAQQSAEAAKGKAPAPVVPAPAVPDTKAVTPTTVPPLSTTPTPPTKAPEPVKAAEPVKAPEPVKAAEPVKAPEPPKAAEVAKVEPPKSVEPIKAPEPAPVIVPPVGSAPEKTAEPPKAVTPPASPPAKSIVKGAPPPPQPSFLEDLMANTPTWAIGAGLLAILGGIAALVAARRRKTTKFEDSIISGTDIKTNTVFGSTGGGVVNTGENSLASDFSREGLGNIDTDEVDPIAEAEVYLAYGRDAQAEEILKDALKKDPQRQEIYLKLLEIHAQHNKPSAFETVASELYSVSQGQGEIWQKAVALGRQLDPNNPMFADGAAPASPRVPAPSSFEPAAFAMSPEPMAPAKPTVANADPLDFQLDEEISISPTSGSAVSAFDRGETTIQKLNEVIERHSIQPRVAATAASFASSFAPKPAPMPTPMEQKVESVRREVADKLDLDFRLDDDEKPAPMQKREQPMPVGQGVAESGPLGGTSLTRPAAAIELDKLELGFDPDRATFEDPTPSVLDGQWHDAATKLDLAKAYQEMGDVEGAREILQEVLHEGDAQQKSEAQGLLAKLA
ncbi:MAG TPA: FimV/HubP family polar landmark protein [Casimicrobiaceae bacterium]|nr:FimV/HubP family polar landmark protein [Casimicrobiaceae bacterium]